MSVDAQKVQSRRFGNRNSRTHGHASHIDGRSPTYQSWQSMRERCTRPESDQWPDYGGRGIKVCERWLRSFESFLADMGERPPGTTLERNDRDGDYEPGNCRWATAKEQARNRRSNTVIEFRGRTQCVAAWCEELGVNYPMVIDRLKRGWSPERALTQPSRLRPKERR